MCFGKKSAQKAHYEYSSPPRPSSVARKQETEGSANPAAAAASPAVAGLPPNVSPSMPGTQKQQQQQQLHSSEAHPTPQPTPIPAAAQDEKIPTSTMDEGIEKEPRRAAEENSTTTTTPPPAEKLQKRDTDLPIPLDTIAVAARDDDDLPIPLATRTATEDLPIPLQYRNGTDALPIPVAAEQADERARERAGSNTSAGANAQRPAPGLGTSAPFAPRPSNDGSAGSASIPPQQPAVPELPGPTPIALLPSNTNQSQNQPRPPKKHHFWQSSSSHSPKPSPMPSPKPSSHNQHLYDKPAVPVPQASTLAAVNPAEAQAAYAAGWHDAMADARRTQPWGLVGEIYVQGWNEGNAARWRALDRGNNDGGNNGGGMAAMQDGGGGAGGMRTARGGQIGGAVGLVRPTVGPAVGPAGRFGDAAVGGGQQGKGHGQQWGRYA